VLAWLAVGGSLIALAVLSWVQRRWRSRRPVARLAVLTVAAAALAAALVATVPLVQVALRYAESVESQGNQAGVRGTLWANGLVAISESPFVGWGPGPHSGLFEPFSHDEAHNSFIDLGMSGGLVAVCALVGYLLWLAYGMARRRDVTALCGLVAIVIFSCFHYVLRQPAFWFLTLGLAAMGQGAGPRAEASPRLQPTRR
jgi:O-antigen ligase